MTTYRVCRTNGTISHIQSDSIPAILKHFGFEVRWIATLDSDDVVWGVTDFRV